MEQTANPVREYTYEQMLVSIDVIVHQIMHQKAFYKRIIALPRGGLVPATYLAHRLHIDKVQTLEEFLADEEVKWSSHTVGPFLLVDDISDSGGTLQTVVNRIKLTCGVGETLSVATLLVRVGTCHTPRYFHEVICNNDWIKFPWEV